MSTLDGHSPDSGRHERRKALVAVPGDGHKPPPNLCPLAHHLQAARITTAACVVGKVLAVAAQDKSAGVLVAVRPYISIVVDTRGIDVGVQL